MADGKIYMIPSVLSEGVFEPISDQIRAIIRQVDVFYVENVRSARRFISGLKTGIVIDTLTFEVLDKNTSEERLDLYMATILEGKTAGIISESGCPGVADPGAKLVSRAHRSGIAVLPLSGPSSILLSLMASGFNGQSFMFHGYLPIDKREREQTLRKLELEVSKNGVTQIFIETPYRNWSLMDSILRVCQKSTLLCVACNMTSPQELIQTKSIGAWAKEVPDLHKMPCIFLLGR